MIQYPIKLELIFEKLNKNAIKPIIVGGFIRDFLLHKESKDIDIELYGVSSLEVVEKILKEFGSINSIGKSFGVCKLSYEDLDLDFSLPREDSKISSGHKGFNVNIYKNLEFKTAASRRDFTINSMGYDVKNKKLLDPFNGKKDLQKKLLKAVDLDKFAEDPLRVLRAIGFSARFNFSLEKQLFCKCKTMIQEGMLQELAQERIYVEIEKMLLKSPQASQAFKLLKELDGFLYFKEFTTLTNEEFKHTLRALDIVQTNITLMLAVLSHKFSNAALINFLPRVTNKKSLLKEVLSLVQNQKSININSFTKYDVYKLAIFVNIEKYAEFLHAIYHNEKNTEIQKLLKMAKELSVLHTKAKPLLQGKDLIKLGLKPSQEYSKILSEAYDAQIHSVFSDSKEALIWLKKRIRSS